MVTQVDERRLDAPAVRAPDAPPFIVQPYLQLGTAGGTSLVLIWHSAVHESQWRVQLRHKHNRSWLNWTDCSLAATDSTIANLGSRRRFVATLTGLKAGQPFEYRVFRNDERLFNARGRALPATDEAMRFLVLGDGADGSHTARRIAHLAGNCKPDLLLFAGDNAYEDGRVSEYEQEFFPIYNDDHNTAETGAPLLRQAVSAAVVGNHDVRTPGFEDRATQDGESEEPTAPPAIIDAGDDDPDILGYFRFFSHPDNGPQLTKAQIKELEGGKKKRKRIARFVGKDFITRTNFSLDAGSVHVLMLDGNKYADWTNEQLRAWVEQDLAAAKESVWKIAVIHQPPFTGGDYKNEQRTRMLCDIFQNHGVDVVFSGHCHAYERSYPLRFFVDPTKIEAGAEVLPGTLALDLEYDGKINTRPNGVIYVVTGTAGHIEEQAHYPQKVETTCKVVVDVPSLTMCDVRGRTLIVRQLAADGTEIDAFMIDK